MLIVNGYREGVSLPSLVLAIGNFDGVHLGHASLLNKAKELACTQGVEFGVYTFWPHPRAVLDPKGPPQLITTREQKLACLGALGVHFVVEEPFTLEFASMAGKEFCEQVIAKSLRASAVVTGENFRFGHRAAGTPQKMAEWLSGYNIAHHLAPSVLVNGELCSSSRIRELVQKGDVERANGMLGRAFAIVGTVIRGAGRGRTIGVPTANLVPSSSLLPGAGVYATSVRIGDEVFKAATNVGTRPTFSENPELHIESHLLNFDRDIYGLEIEIFFHRKIRQEMKFESVEALRLQIQEDLLLVI